MHHVKIKILGNKPGDPEGRCNLWWEETPCQEVPLCKPQEKSFIPSNRRGDRGEQIQYMYGLVCTLE